MAQSMCRYQSIPIYTVDHGSVTAMGELAML